MNIAVRTLNQASLISTRISLILLSKAEWVVIGLVFAVLLSAFGVVYIKDTNRRLMSESQTLQNVQENLEIQWGRLLLEESAWSAASRVQDIAENNLNMVMPDHQTLITSETVS